MSHLEKSIRIHAPLARVYAFAHDPRHWDEWYVGISEEREFAEAGETTRKHRYLMVGTPFPLTQVVKEDWIHLEEARWRARHDGSPQCAELTADCELLMLASDQEWDYRADDGETEITVAVDFKVPADLLDQPGDQTVVERLEASCLERSLANLKRLCEVSH